MQDLKKRIESLNQNIGFYYKNLMTQEVYSYNEKKTFVPASVIKLPILVGIFWLAFQKKLSFEDTLLVKNEDKLPSCGALNSFSREIEVDLLTLCRLMITISDNTATNLLIRYCGQDVLNEFFCGMNLKDTRINRLLFDEEASLKGIENQTTAFDMGILLEKLYRRQILDVDSCDRILEILSKQQINHKFKEKLPQGIQVAHKTGEDSGISNDVGIIYARQPFILSIFSNEADIYRVNDFMRNISYEFFEKNHRPLVR